MSPTTNAAPHELSPRRVTSWTQRWIEFLFFLILFAAYDSIVLLSQTGQSRNLSLINYIVRDGRTDESAMYWPFVREAAAGRIRTTDPYLVEYQRSPDLKPRLPTLVCAAVLRCMGDTNWSVLIIHALFPAMAALLLVEISAVFISRNAALALTILSVAGVAFAWNDLFVALRVTDLGGPHKYNAIEHFYSGSGLHMEFQRFFSPGLTLFPFLLGLWILLSDAKLQKLKTLAIAGAILGLHTEIYIHGGVTYATLVCSLIALCCLRDLQKVPFSRTLWNLTWRAGIFFTFTFMTSWPWLMRYRAFRLTPYATEIMFRVGNFDFTPDIYRLPMLAWTFLAIYMRHVALLRECKTSNPSSIRFLDNPLDLIWASLVLTEFIAGWFAGIAGDWGLFPCSHLINYRYLSYLAPLMVAYPAALLLNQARAQGHQTAVTILKTAGALGMLFSLVAILHGEARAALNCAPLYGIPPEIAKIRDEVIPATPPGSVIMTDDLRVTSYLVCESNRKTYIGYASVSLAPTGELIDRLMIPSIVVGRSFEEFERDHYARACGLPQGPNGQHWVLHHGGDIQPVPKEVLAERYEGLRRLPAEDLFHRYRFDFAYFQGVSPIEPYGSLLRPTKVEGLYQRSSVAPSASTK